MISEDKAMEIVEDYLGRKYGKRDTSSGAVIIELDGRNFWRIYCPMESKLRSIGYITGCASVDGTYKVFVDCLTGEIIEPGVDDKFGMELG